MPYNAVLMNKRKNNIGLYEWLETVPKPKTRLYNILRQLCLKEFNDGMKDISPLGITKEEFLKLKNAGERSWKDFEELRKLNESI